MLHEKKGSDINIIYDPELPKKASHSLVVDLTPDDKDEYRVATALVRLITKADTYPGHNLTPPRPCPGPPNQLLANPDSGQTR